MPQATPNWDGRLGSRARASSYRWRRKRTAPWHVRIRGGLFSPVRHKARAHPADRSNPENRLTSHHHERKFPVEPLPLAFLLPEFLRRRATPEKGRRFSSLPSWVPWPSFAENKHAMGRQSGRADFLRHWVSPGG